MREVGFKGFKGDVATQDVNINKLITEFSVFLA
jgi:hypothetical protein